MPNLDSFQTALVLMLTIIGLFCLYDILELLDYMSRKQFWSIVSLGPMSYSVQILIIMYLWEPVTFSGSLSLFLTVGTLVLVAYLAFKVVVTKWEDSCNDVDIPPVTGIFQKNISCGFSGVVIMGEILFPMLLASLLLLDI